MNSSGKISRGFTDIDSFTMPTFVRIYSFRFQSSRNGIFGFKEIFGLKGYNFKYSFDLKFVLLQRFVYSIDFVFNDTVFYPQSRVVFTE